MSIFTPQYREVVRVKPEDIIPSLAAGTDETNGDLMVVCSIADLSLWERRIYSSLYEKETLAQAMKRFLSRRANYLLFLLWDEQIGDSLNEAVEALKERAPNFIDAARESQNIRIYWTSSSQKRCFIAFESAIVLRVVHKPRFVFLYKPKTVWTWKQKEFWDPVNRAKYLKIN